MRHLKLSSIKTYSTIILLSIIFTLYFFETYLTLFNENKNYFMSLEQKATYYKSRTGKNYDTRSKLEIYNDLKQKEPQIGVSVPPFMFIGKKTKVLPFSGAANIKTINCNENGYYSILKSDRYGFNNPDKEWDKNEIEFLFVGDSFVYGDCVNRPNDLSSVVRNLSNKAVLNLGQKGNGPLIMYATLREYLIKNTKNIVWVFYENDITNLSMELTSKKLNNYLKDENFTQDLVKNQKSINKIVSSNISNMFEEGERAEKNLIKNEKMKYRILKFIRLDKTKKVIKKSLNNDEYLYKKFEEILIKSKNLSLNNNSNFYFVYIPKYQLGKKKYNEKMFKRIKKITSMLNIPFIDIYEGVLKQEENSRSLYPFEKKGHFNIEGYRKVAKAILNFTSK